MIIPATGIIHLDTNRQDFKHGLLYECLQIVNIHYHFKCQDITDNAGDNKL